MGVFPSNRDGYNRIETPEEMAVFMGVISALFLLCLICYCCEVCKDKEQERGNGVQSVPNEVPGQQNPPQMQQIPQSQFQQYPQGGQQQLQQYQPYSLPGQQPFQPYQPYVQYNQEPQEYTPSRGPLGSNPAAALPSAPAHVGP